MPYATSFNAVHLILVILAQMGVSPAPINRRVSALQHVFDVLHDHQVVGATPVKPSHGLRRRSALPRALSTEPLAALCAQLQPPMDHALCRLR